MGLCIIVGTRQVRKEGTGVAVLDVDGVVDRGMWRGFMGWWLVGDGDGGDDSR